MDSVYAIVYFDAIVVKIRHEGKVSNRAIYLALGVNLEGRKEILGMWSSPTEGARFWLNVLTELKNRGLQDVFICCVDGLNGFVEAIESVYPETKVQLCIVHMIRNSLKFVSWKERKKVAAELKNIYNAQTAQIAKIALDEFRKNTMNASLRLAEAGKITGIISLHSSTIPKRFVESFIQQMLSNH